MTFHMLPGSVSCHVYVINIYDCLNCVYTLLHCFKVCYPMFCFTLSVNCVTQCFGVCLCFKVCSTVFTLYYILFHCFYTLLILLYIYTVFHHGTMFYTGCSVFAMCYTVLHSSELGLHCVTNTLLHFVHMNLLWVTRSHTSGTGPS